MKTIRKRQLSFFGHICRKDGIEKLVLTGKLEGKLGKGRPRTSYLNSLKKWTGLDKANADFIRLADNREDWRNMVNDVCNRQCT